MRITPTTWIKVLAFPSQEGLKPRKPVITLIAPATATIAMSRPMTVAVTQNGTGKWRGVPTTLDNVSITKAVVIRSLSAIGSMIVPSSDSCFIRRAIKPSTPSETPAMVNTTRAQPSLPYTSKIAKTGISAMRRKVRRFGIVRTFVETADSLIPLF